MRLKITRPFAEGSIFLPGGRIEMFAEAPGFPALGKIYASFRDSADAFRVRREAFEFYPEALYAIEAALRAIERVIPVGAVCLDGTFEFVCHCPNH